MQNPVYLYRVLSLDKNSSKDAFACSTDSNLFVNLGIQGTTCRYLWPEWPRKRTNKEVSVNSHLNLGVVHLFDIAQAEHLD